MMKKPLLVIIDDEQDNLELLRYNFVRKGIQVKTFTQGGRAWEFLQFQRPDMIVCDCVVLTEEGENLCKRIKEDPNLTHVPLVMSSYQTNRSASDKAIKYGAIDYIIKPIKAYDLVNRIEKLMKRRVSL